MKPELEKKLYNDFPQFFKDKDDMQKSLMCFGCDCGDGWFDIIYNLTKEIAAILSKDDEFQIIQIKEKFGTLRYYNNLHSPDFQYRLPYTLNRLTKYRIQRFFDRLRTKLNLLTKFERVNNLVHSADNLSAITCEVCGASGNLRNDLGWIKTLCDKHYKQVKKRRVK